MCEPSLSPDPALASAAARVLATLVKTRARHYARRPMTLDTLYPGLSCASPDALVAVATHLLDGERHKARRWFGFGGEATIINVKAALLLGRLRKRARRRAGPCLAKPDPQQHVSSLI